jgi:hypothetical protein
MAFIAAALTRGEASRGGKILPIDLINFGYPVASADRWQRACG